MDNDSRRRVYVASDHNGTAARNYVIHILKSLNVEAVDLGPSEYDGKVDYPDYAHKLCDHLNASADGDVGILICGTGTGMLIAANRFWWVRAGLATDHATAMLMRQHNDANVLVLGQWRTPLGQMGEIIKTFLETKFEAGRHTERVMKLTDLT